MLSITVAQKPNHPLFSYHLKAVCLLQELEEGHQLDHLPQMRVVARDCRPQLLAEVQLDLELQLKWIFH